MKTSQNQNKEIIDCRISTSEKTRAEKRVINGLLCLSPFNEPSATQNVYCFELSRRKIIILIRNMHEKYNFHCAGFFCRLRSKEDHLGSASITTVRI